MRIVPINDKGLVSYIKDYAKKPITFVDGEAVFDDFKVKPNGEPCENPEEKRLSQWFFYELNELINVSEYAGMNTLNHARVFYNMYKLCLDYLLKNQMRIEEIEEEECEYSDHYISPRG